MGARHSAPERTTRSWGSWRVRPPTPSALCAWLSVQAAGFEKLTDSHLLGLLGTRMPTGPPPGRATARVHPDQVGETPGTPAPPPDSRGNQSLRTAVFPAGLGGLCHHTLCRFSSVTARGRRGGAAPGHAAEAACSVPAAESPAPGHWSCCWAPTRRPGATSLPLWPLNLEPLVWVPMVSGRRPATSASLDSQGVLGPVDSSDLWSETREEG